MRSLVRGGALALLLALGGCNSLGGTQESALTSSVTTITASTYTRDAIIAAYGQANGDDAKRLYRAQIAALFMEAIDENYDRFAAGIFREGVEMDLGFDSAIIGLSTFAALDGGAAQEVAGIVAGTAGLQSSIDKNLYFDRTLPALIAIMDARRSRVEADILANLRQSPSDYPVQMLLRDLRRYQQAGSLYRAIVDVTAEASAERDDAEEAAEQQRQFESGRAFSCEPGETSEADLDLLAPLIASVRADSNAASAASPDQAASVRLRFLAEIVGAESSGSIPTVRDAILTRLDTGICTADQLNDVITRFNEMRGQ